MMFTYSKVIIKARQCGKLKNNNKKKSFGGAPKGTDYPKSAPAQKLPYQFVINIVSFYDVIQNSLIDPHDL